MRLISQLIKGISRVLQELLKCVNGAAIFAFYNASIISLCKNFDLNLNDSNSVVIFFGSSLQYSHKLPDIFE